MHNKTVPGRSGASRPDPTGLARGGIRVLPNSIKFRTELARFMSVSSQTNMTIQSHSPPDKAVNKRKDLDDRYYRFILGCNRRIRSGARYYRRQHSIKQRTILSVSF